MVMQTLLRVIITGTTACQQYISVGEKLGSSLNTTCMESIYNKEATEGSVYEKLLRANVKSNGNSTKPVSTGFSDRRPEYSAVTLTIVEDEEPGQIPRVIRYQGCESILIKMIYHSFA